MERHCASERFHIPYLLFRLAVPFLYSSVLPLTRANLIHFEDVLVLPIYISFGPAVSLVLLFLLPRAFFSCSFFILPRHVALLA
jgi:hypothetical protein